MLYRSIFRFKFQFTWTIWNAIEETKASGVVRHNALYHSPVFPEAVQPPRIAFWDISGDRKSFNHWARPPEVWHRWLIGQASPNIWPAVLSGSVPGVDTALSAPLYIYSPLIAIIWPLFTTVYSLIYRRTTYCQIFRDFEKPQSGRIKKICL